MTQRIVGFLFACLLYVAMPLRAAPQEELIFGVYPYLSPNQIVEQFTPLSDHLAASLGRPVTLRSAPDFASFIERTRAGEYDIIFTAPHMGHLAERRDGFLPLAQSGVPIIVVAVVKKDSPIKTLDDLRDRRLAVGAKMSMTYQVMRDTLERKGLELGRNVHFIDTASFSNVLEAVLRGDADAGATATLLWDNTPADKRGQLREFYRAPPVPGFFLLANRRNEALQDKMQKALISFATTPAGKTYFGKTGQIDFRPLDAATLKRMDPYTTVFNAP